jgi:hypothetical protein
MSLAVAVALARDGISRTKVGIADVGPATNGTRCAALYLCLTTEGIEMNFFSTPIAVLLLATIGVSGADAQPAKTGSAEPIHVGNVPANIQVPAGNHAFLEGHGAGTQNYVCAPSTSSPTGVAYALFTPEATLFSDDFKQLTTHFFSPSPSEVNTNPAVIAAGPIRATWQHRDSSTVWGKVRPADPTVPGDIGDASTDPAFVAPGAIAWLKVTATASVEGPTGGDTLTKTTFIQRLNTSGGVAPSTGCAAPTDVGHQAFVPYKADYFFYKAD